MLLSYATTNLILARLMPKAVKELTASRNVTYEYVYWMGFVPSMGRVDRYGWRTGE